MTIKDSPTNSLEIKGNIQTMIEFSNEAAVTKHCQENKDL